jgi:hypothetical protein
MRRAAACAVLCVFAGIAGTAGTHAGLLVAQSAVPSGFGKLAYVWRGHLYVLDASGRRQITFRGLAMDAAWSRDGRSLTYQVGPPSSTGQYQQWTVQSDGSGARRLAASFCAACVSPDGRRIVTVSRGWIPPRHGQGNGHAVNPSISIVGRPDRRVIWQFRLSWARGKTIDFRGWWPDGRALLFQLDPMNSGSLAADGLTLYSLALGNGRVHRLVGTLDYEDWISTRGSRVLIVAGFGRSAYANKRVVLCGEEGGCHAVAGGNGTVAVDPAWSPSGNGIAWVQAPAHPNLAGPGSDRVYRQWENSRTLWTAAPNGTHAAPIHSVGGGIADPQWTRHGRGVLYVRDNAIWYDPHLGAGTSVMLAHLFPSGQLSQFGGYWDDLFYYWHIRWERLFAWWQPS